MPWTVEKSSKCSPTMPWAVVKDADGTVEGCHATEAMAQRHRDALYAAEGSGGSMARSAASGDGILYRSFIPDLHVRSAGDGRTIYGIAVPYRKAIRINESLVEQWARGAFNHQLREPSRVKFAREHMLLGGTLIGAASAMRDDAAGLYVELRASKTPVGDETIELVRDGALDELSIMFRERQNRRLPGGITERVTADLREVAVVMAGAYGNLATAIGVRSAYADPPTAINAALRAQAEEYLFGLPQLEDHELEIRALRLGLKPLTT